MILVKIIANGIQLDLVSETIVIRKENNSFSEDFKINHTSRPFLIVENKKTIEALGPREMTSINKKKIIQVEVVESDIAYKGELQILSYVNGFRKANLKYSSNVFSILTKKLAEFMPVVSVIPGETSPVPYTEESNDLIAGESYWNEYPLDFLDKSYPDVKWQFPTISWRDQFGKGLVEGDEWFKYQGFMNKYHNDSFVLNTHLLITLTLYVANKNVASPQLYVLSPLFYALDSLGYKLTGSFTTSNFIKNLLLLNTKNNNTVVALGAVEPSVIFTGPWELYTFFPAYYLFGIKQQYLIPFSTKYLIKYRFVLPLQTSTSPQAIKTSFIIRTRLEISGLIFNEEETPVFILNYNLDNQVIEGEVEADLTAGYQLYFEYYSINSLMPVEYDISITKADEIKNYYQMHPTIDFKRYAPDKTVGNYINDLKKLFNLKFEVDDVAKELKIDFVEDSILTEPLILNKSMNIDTYEVVATSSFVLKYNNTEDTALYISNTLVEPLVSQTDSFTKTISSDFKFIPHNGVTSELSSSIESKTGIGLILYNPESGPFTVSSLDGKNLSITGEGGIWDTFWKKTLKIRLSASKCEITGGFTKTEITKLNKTEDVYFNNQHFKVLSIEITPDSETFFSVKMDLESVNL